MGIIKPDQRSLGQREDDAYAYAVMGLTIAVMSMIDIVRIQAKRRRLKALFDVPVTTVQFTEVDGVPDWPMPLSGDIPDPDPVVLAHMYALGQVAARAQRPAGPGTEMPWGPTWPGYERMYLTAYRAHMAGHTFEPSE